MPDKISPEERKLIDDALKEGRVTYVPKGAVGIPINLTQAQVHAHILKIAVYGIKSSNKERREKIIRMLNNGVSPEVVSSSMRITKENLAKLMKNYAHLISIKRPMDT